MRVTIVERKKDGDKWVYRLEDTDRKEVDSGNFFPETELRNWNNYGMIGGRYTSIGRKAICRGNNLVRDKAEIAWPYLQV